MTNGFRHNVRTYFEMTSREWIAVLATAAVAGFCLSFNDWGDEQFELASGLASTVFDIVAAFALLSVHVLAQKLTGIFFGIKVIYDKYALGLLVGVFVTFLTFGYWPFFITGYLTYFSIPNLRIGKFRATMPKKWEAAVIAGAGIFASLLITIPLNLFHLVTGADVFRNLIGISLLIAIYALLPLPLLQTPNPYQVYMSRLESLEGNLPGYDIFFAAPSFYAMVVGVTIAFALLSIVFQPSILMLLLATFLGGLAMWAYIIYIQTVR